MQVLILVFDGAEELDFVGPWEVLTSARQLLSLHEPPVRLAVALVSEHGGTITCAKGMRVLADHSFETAPVPDVILVPGGQGTRREMKNPAVLRWVAGQAAHCRWVTSVCTGAMVLAAAGPARGRRVTTYFGAIGEFARQGTAGEIVAGERWVVDGNVVTAAGVSAGIDMTLWLVGELFGAEVGRATQRAIEYNPAPPY
jgi:transcriptional regulator GlxA family with amidase domain